MTWELVWKIVLIGVLAAFSVMAVLVSVLGAFDIRKLLRKLREEKNEDETPES